MKGGRDMWQFWKPHNWEARFFSWSSSFSCKLNGPQVGATLLHKALWECLKAHFLSHLEWGVPLAFSAEKGPPTRVSYIHLKVNVKF